jgi:hypothetical protein
MRHIGILALSGILMGVLSTFVGLPFRVEFSLWLIVYLLWIVYAVRVRLERPVRRLVAASTLAGLLTGSIQVLFMEQYKASNPWYAEFFDSPARQLATQFLGQGIGLGLVFGLLVGLTVRWRLARGPNGQEE